MPIVRIATDPAPGELAQTCGACGALNVVPLDALVLGAGTSTDVDPNAVVLPACACGARETLLRTFDACPAAFAGTAFAAQRRAANALAQHLKAQGRSHPDARARHDAEPAAPPDLDALPLADVPLPPDVLRADGDDAGGRR